jgi:hypothetical protein
MKNKKIDIRKYDWVIQETGEPVIIDGVALRDIEEGENLVSYGKIVGVLEEKK